MLLLVGLGVQNKKSAPQTCWSKERLALSKEARGLLKIRLLQVQAKVQLESCYGLFFGLFPPRFFAQSIQSVSPFIHHVAALL